MTGQMRWSLATTVVGIIVMLIFCLWYTGKTARDSERKWCGIVVTMDEAYATPRPPGSPPLTVTGQRIVEEMHRLRAEFGCN